MLKRVLVDVGIGVALAIAGQFMQMAAGEVGRALGLPFAYEMAPADGSVPAALLDQISLMFALAAVGMLVVCLAIGWVLRVRGPAEGVQRGLVWAAVVGLSQAALGLGEGVVPVFGLAGTWAYLAAIVAGPVLAGVLSGVLGGVLGARRPG